LALPDVPTTDPSKPALADTSIPTPPTVPTLPETLKSPEQTKVEKQEAATPADPNAPQLPNAPLVQPEEKISDTKMNIAQENLLKALNEPLKKPSSSTDPLKSESKTEIATRAAKKAGPIKYFDAPAGEILNDIQPPSIDVSRNPGESIIIVQKPVGYDNSYRAGDETIKIERSGATDIISDKAISADRAMRLGRYDIALNFYNDMLDQNPNDINALLGRAISWQRMGQNNSAENAYRDVLRRDPSNVTAATNLASIQSKESPQRAIENLSKVYQDNPNDQSIKGQMGVSMAQSGDLDDAYQSFLSATQNDPKKPMRNALKWMLFMERAEVLIEM
jgi:Flp pilus assembly protein TadD